MMSEGLRCVCARAVLFAQARVLETRRSEHSEGEHLDPIRTLESMSGSGYIRPGGYGGTSPVYTCCGSSFQGSIVALPGLSVDKEAMPWGETQTKKMLRQSREELLMQEEQTPSSWRLPFIRLPPGIPSLLLHFLDR